MPISHIVRIPDGKAFGFIKGLGQDEDYFFHRDDVDFDFDLTKQELKSHRQVKVQFEIEERPKGLRAINVRRV